MSSLIRFILALLAALTLAACGGGDAAQPAAESPAATATFDDLMASPDEPGLAAPGKAAGPPWTPWLPPALTAMVTATPASALTRQNADFLVSDSVAIHYALTYRAPADCTGARLVISRRAPPAAPIILLDLPVALVPGPGGMSSTGSTAFDFALGQADNGKFFLRSDFTCTRPSGSRRSGSLLHRYDVNVPNPPAVAPAMTTQPSSQTVDEPDPATFTAAATGSPAPTAQWQVSIDNGNTWTAIAGATGTSYTTPATRATDSGQLYRVVFSNVAGSATSLAAALTVNALPVGVPPFLGRWGVTSAADDGQGGLVREPQVACVRTDTCFAVWARVSTNDLAYSGVYAARYTRSGNWETPRQLSGDQGREPRVAVDNQGRAFVMWVSGASAGTQAYVRRFVSPATGWETPSLLSPGTAGSSAGSHDIAMNGDGLATAVFAQRVQPSGSTPSYMLQLTHFANGAWATPWPVASDVVLMTGVTVAVDRLGRAALAWRDSSNLVNAATTDVSGGVDAVAVHVPATTVAPKVALDADGRAFVAWISRDTSTNIDALEMARHEAGGTWQPRSSFAMPVGASLQEVEVAAGPAGRAAVIYTLNNSRTVALRDFTASGGWGSETVLDSAAGRGVTKPRVVMDTGGNLTVAWQRRDDLTIGAAVTRSFAPGLGWKPALAANAFELATYDADLPGLALGAFGDGRAAMVAISTNASFVDRLVLGAQIP